MVQCARKWLLDEKGNVRNNIQHICWDGCMFANETLENPKTWTNILDVMQQIQADVDGIAG